MIKKNLSELSFDKNNQIKVCDYENSFIDLDDTKGCLRRSSIANTPDMLYIDDDREEIWFVEFKSSNYESLNSWKEKSKLRKKIFAGLFLIYEIFCEESCEYKKYEKFYFIVYNKNEVKSAEDELLDMFSSASQREIEFGLDDLKPQFVKDIFTEDCEELVKLFKARFSIEFTKENR